jgi:glutamate 5-kinase
MSSTFNRRASLSGVRRVVVKVGTNVLTRATGEMAVERVESLIADVAELHAKGLQVITVTSGAISMGMDRLGLRSRPASLPEKQACAAVGQVRLMSVYEQAFQKHGITVAQILLTEDDFASRVRYLNLRNTLSTLLEHRAIPVINENDTVSTSEIETGPEAVAAAGSGSVRKSIFGDNDRLSALVMSKLGADLLILLSDVDGLYPVRPDAADSAGRGPSGAPLSVVEEITPEIESMARGGNARGRGGMQSKLQSIKVALEGGGLAVIANGASPGVIQKIVAGDEVGTIFLPRRKIASRKRWIAHASAPAGKVLVNAGARQAIVDRQASLLFAGVVAIEGDFKRGDVVTISDEARIEIARGIVNYAARDAVPLLGKRSNEIAALAGEDYEELITRDNIALT